MDLLSVPLRCGTSDDDRRGGLSDSVEDCSKDESGRREFYHWEADTMDTVPKIMGQGHSVVGIGDKKAPAFSFSVKP